MRWGEKTLKGYWRHPTVPAIVPVEQILRIPTDRGDGNLLRAQTTAAGLAVNAQLRADENRLRHRAVDRLPELLERVAEEERKRAARRTAEGKLRET
jgi:hypothetical protein